MSNNKTIDDIPTFSAPQDDIPTFSAPQDDIPTFSAPHDDIPTFSAPQQNHSHNGPVCFHHPTEPAVAQCARCGKYICKDCAEAYGVTAGEYAGKHLCYDCCEEIVRLNIQELIFLFILSLIGVFIVFSFGYSITDMSSSFGSRFLVGLIYACIGGVFLSAMKSFFSLLGEVIKIAFSGNFGIITIFSLLWNLVVLVFRCITTTISNTFFYIKYLRQTSGFIESDSAALQRMRDYMEYTLVRNQNGDVSLDDLMREGSQLYNNSYAQAVRDNGEEAADAMLREATTSIAENGEIIRSFDNAA